jgi:hypothetical protein
VARTRKIKFDTNNVFFKNQHTPEQKAKFLRSPLFPVFVSAYNTAEGVIRVGEIREYATAQKTNTKVMLVNDYGLGVGVLESHTGDQLDVNDSFTYHSVTSAISSSFQSMNRLIMTSNPRYLQSKLSSKSDHDAATWLRRSAKEAKEAIGATVRTMVDRCVDAANGESIGAKPVIKVSERISTYLSLVVMGKMALNEVPASIRAQFDDAFRAYMQRQEKFEGALRIAEEFVSGEKWLLIPSLNNGVFFAAINGETIKPNIRAYQSAGHLDMDVSRYTDYTIKPEWYPSMQDIPEQYRTELEYSLTMLKTHRNSNDMIPVIDSWSDKTEWREIGAAMYNSHSGKMLMLQR